VEITVLMEEGVVLLRGSLVLYPFGGEEYCCVHEAFGLDLDLAVELRWDPSNTGDGVGRLLDGSFARSYLASPLVGQCWMKCPGTRHLWHTYPAGAPEDSPGDRRGDRSDAILETTSPT
jgi:hypothetical protein